MKLNRRFFIFTLLFCSVFLTAAGVSPESNAAPGTDDALAKREDAYRANAVLEGDDSSMGLGDPAMIEGHAEQASPAPPSQPPTVQTKKPPTSFR